MRVARLARFLRDWLWEHSLTVRTPLRAVRRQASLALYRWRFPRTPLPPRVAGMKGPVAGRTALKRCSTRTAAPRKGNGDGPRLPPASRSGRGSTATSLLSSRPMRTPEISVVIPSYNHGRFITEAVTSVLASPMDDLELVVVDDGSTDDTLERLEAFHDDPRVRVFPQANQGAHAAFNRGLTLVRGDIVFLLNSDDAFEPERIPRCLGRFRANPRLALVSSWIRVVDEEGKTLGVKEGFRNMPPWPPPTAGPYLSDTGELPLALLEANFVATTSNAAFPRRLLADPALTFRPLRYAHDWDFLLSLCAHGDFELLEEPLVRYRVHGSNTIQEGSDQARGQGLMRFEALWVVARHALPACARYRERGHDVAELEWRAMQSLPRFGRLDILEQLLELRGRDPQPPPAYDALISPDHPFRRAAVDALG